MQTDNFTNRLFKNIFLSSNIKWMLGLGVMVFFAGIYNRYIYIDDAYFGEQVYYFLTEGVVKTPSLIDFNGGEFKLFVYHKLHIFLGAGIVKLFGWSIEPLRCCTMIAFILLAFVLYRHIDRYAFGLTKVHAWIGVVFLFINPLIFLYGYTFRPEITVTLFGFLSYAFLYRHIEFSEPRYFALVAGVFAGVTFLFHLNGLAFMLAGTILLVFKGRYRSSLIFLLAAGSVALLYFWDLWQPGHLETMLYQIKNWPDDTTTNYSSDTISGFMMNMFIKLSKEQQRFFWSYKVWGTSVIFIVTLLFFFKKIFKANRSLVIYLFFLIISLNVAGSHVAERYLIYYLPFISILVANGIVFADSGLKRFPQIVFMGLFAVQFFFVGNMMQTILKKNRNYPEIHAKVLKSIPDKSSLILVPYEFVFNGISEYNIATYKGIEYYEAKLNKKLSKDQFFERAHQLGIKYIILPEGELEYENTSIKILDDNRGGIDYSGTKYQLFNQNESATILKLTDQYYNK